MKNSISSWLGKKKGEQTIKNLEKHGFHAQFVNDSKAASELLLEMTKDYNSFGFAGSDTTRTIGVIDQLKTSGKKIYDHWIPDLSPGESLDIRKKQSQADCFLCSANAISMSGEIVNVDGIGNRTNGMSFGPQKVIIVAGINKVTKDLDSALARVHEVAAPMRAKSLNMDTPCGKTGICADCNSPQRLCRITVILHRKPMLTDISVILVNESLGY